ncbi:hypothetical protein ACUN0C_18685 [Faunimonas sp. B44]|uniref:hypothetical protein n=1 Tax=Faunimonas sp. B44 TaxID=3461493 RepID=UPI0040441F68
MQPGDKVRCVKAYNSGDILTHGAIYTIKTICGEELVLEGVDHPCGFWSACRFEPLPRYVVVVDGDHLSLEEAEAEARNLAKEFLGIRITVAEVHSTFKAEVTINESRCINTTGIANDFLKHGEIYTISSAGDWDLVLEGVEHPLGYWDINRFEPVRQTARDAAAEAMRELHLAGEPIRYLDGNNGGDAAWLIEPGVVVYEDDPETIVSVEWDKDRWTLADPDQYVVTLGPTITLEEAEKHARDLALANVGMEIKISKLHSTLKAIATLKRLVQTGEVDWS